MRSLSFLHLLLFLLATLVCKCSQAQDYVVTLKNDTLRGKLRVISSPVEPRVTVIDDNKKKTTFSIVKTKGYSHDGQIYHPVRMQKGYVFMKLIKSGYLSLYGYQVESQTSYDGRFLLKRDGSSLDVPNLSFKKFMVRFLNECTETVAQIENGDLKKSDLEKIVDSYNTCIDGYTKKQQMNKNAIVRDANILTVWNTLQEKIKSHPAFDDQASALEMIDEIKNKVERNERAPNFLIEGLKNALAKTELQTELENALKTL